MKELGDYIIDISMTKTQPLPPQMKLDIFKLTKFSKPLQYKTRDILSYKT